MDRGIARRLASQLLSGTPADSPEAVVGRLLAVQAQDLRGARLAVRCRSVGLYASDVDHALTDQRSLLVTWLNRGTLHLVRAEDYWWMHPLTTPQLATTNERRLRQEGVTPRQAERGIAVVSEALGLEGPQTREQLRTRLDGAGVPTAGQALVHVLLAASLQGRVVRGPTVGADHLYVSVPDWLGPAPPKLGDDDGLGMLARRYLAGHGPASAHDLARWAGLTVGQARRGFAAIEAETVLGDDGLADLADRAGPGDAADVPAPRLLGPFDPLLHGWASRAAVVGPHAGVVTTNGIFRPVALVDGRVVATWGLPRSVVTISPLETMAPEAREALAEDASDVLRYLGLAARPAVVL